jgi:hypothetical protein
MLLLQVQRPPPSREKRPKNDLSFSVHGGGGGFGGGCGVEQCFPTAGPRPGTGLWHQLYWAARGKYFIVEIF